MDSKEIETSPNQANIVATWKLNNIFTLQTKKSAPERRQIKVTIKIKDTAPRYANCLFNAIIFKVPNVLE